MGNMILSAFADEYASDFDGQLKALQKFEIGHIEIRHVDDCNVSLLTGEQVKTVKQKLDAAGIGVSSIGSPLGKIALDGDLAGHMETAKRVFETANTLGAKYIRVFSFYAPEGQEITDLKERVFEQMEQMLLLARRAGVTLCHENEAKIYGDVPVRCRELLDRFGGELKCVFDMGNFVLEGVDPYPSAYELLKPYVAYFHIKDALYAGAIVPPGKGEARIGEILHAHAKSSQEDFFVSLEPHLQTFSGLNALVGRSFQNPYQYENQEVAFADAVEKLKELI